MESHPNLKPGLLVCDQADHARVGILLPTRRYSIVRGTRLVHYPDKREHVLAARLVIMGKATRHAFQAAKNLERKRPVSAGHIVAAAT